MSLDIDRLVHGAEGQYIERKSAKIDPKDILKEIVGFANANGGTLIIGVENNGEITGFKAQNAKEPSEFIEAIRTLLRKPPLDIKERIEVIENTKGQWDRILVLDIAIEPNRVVENYDGEAYLRVNDKTIKLNYEERRKLEYDKGQRYFEDEEVKDSSSDDIDYEIIALFQEKLDSKFSSGEELLISRNLMRNGHLTNAGLLLFGKDPSKYLPGARIRFLRFEGDKMKPGAEFNLVKEVTITGPIPKMIDEIRKVVSSQLREFQYLDPNTGRFRTMPEYPEYAWSEGIVNALTHRDYTNQGDHIRVSMFDDRLEVFSPGKLPQTVTLENMTYTRFSRNPKIARTLSDFGWVKEINEGVKRIYSEMERYFLGKPVYSEPHGNAVLLQLFNNILNRRVRVTDRMRDIMGSGLLASLSQEEFSVCEYAFNNGKITVSQAMKLIGRARPYTSNMLKKLSVMGILNWRGSNQYDPGQHYVFNDRS
jgi:ATP-dependent DNA helicase RecG